MVPKVLVAAGREVKGFLLRHRQVCFAGLVWVIGVELLVLWTSASGLDLLGLRSTWFSVTEFDDNNIRSQELMTEQIKNFLAGIFLLGGSLAGALTLANAIKRTELQDIETETSRDRLNVDTFSTAVEQLGSEKIEIRLGAIYTLEGLARQELDRNADGYLVEQTLETLAAFVREQSQSLWRNYYRDNKDSIEKALEQLTKFVPQTNTNPPVKESIRLVIAQGQHVEKAREDLAAAVNVIARTYPFEKRPDFKRYDGVDLRDSFLPFLSLPTDADLRRFNLNGAILVGASLRQVNLSRSVLNKTVLRNVDFRYADLTGATFNMARFHQTDFQNAELINCDFGVSYRSLKIKLSGANISGANFAGIQKLDFEQIDSAKWDRAHPPLVSSDNKESLREVIESRRAMVGVG